MQAVPLCFWHTAQLCMVKDKATSEAQEMAIMVMATVEIVSLDR